MFVPLECARVMETLTCRFALAATNACTAGTFSLAIAENTRRWSPRAVRFGSFAFASSSKFIYYFYFHLFFFWHWHRDVRDELPAASKELPSAEFTVSPVPCEHRHSFHSMQRPPSGGGVFGCGVCFVWWCFWLWCLLRLVWFPCFAFASLHAFVTSLTGA